MIALLALLSTVVVGSEEAAVPIDHEGVSVDHICNTLALGGIETYGLGSAGFGIIIRIVDVARAQEILAKDEKLFPFHYGRTSQRKTHGPVKGEKRSELNVGPKSLSSLKKDPLLQAAVKRALETWLACGPSPYVSEVFVSKADYRQRDGSIDPAYFLRLRLRDRENTKYRGYMEMVVSDRGKDVELLGGYSDG